MTGTRTVSCHGRPASVGREARCGLRRPGPVLCRGSRDGATAAASSGAWIRPRNRAGRACGDLQQLMILLILLVARCSSSHRVRRGERARGGLRVGPASGRPGGGWRRARRAGTRAGRLGAGPRHHHPARGSPPAPGRPTAARHGSERSAACSRLARARAAARRSGPARPRGASPSRTRGGVGADSDEALEPLEGCPGPPVCPRAVRVLRGASGARIPEW